MSEGTISDVMALNTFTKKSPESAVTDCRLPSIPRGRANEHVHPQPEDMAKRLAKRPALSCTQDKEILDLTLGYKFFSCTPDKDTLDLTLA